MDTSNEKTGYNIYNASLKEREEIENFLEKNWKKSQILGETFFHYFFVELGSVNFVIARDSSHKNIVGVCGYIRCSDKAAFTSCLLVKKGVGFKLAFQIMNYIMTRTEFLFAVSLSDNGQALWRMYHNYKVGIMDCYYKLFDKQEYHIAKITKKIIRTINFMNHEVELIESKGKCRLIMSDEHFRQQIPYKTVDYVLKRYFEFPYPQYRYDVWGVKTSLKNYTTFIVIREQKVGDSLVARIVDIIGDIEELPKIAGFFEKIGMERNYEYIDCICYGVSKKIMCNTGFVRREAADNNIIPNKLNPLVRENENIYFAAPCVERVRLFLADGDMDRPNLNV